MKSLLCCLVVLSCFRAGAAADAPRALYRIETVAGSSQNGDGGPATAAQIGSIQGLAVDRLGNVYLSDTDHHRVRKIDVHGVITTIAGTGAAGFSGDGGPASLAQLNLPYGVAADANGSVYVADLNNNRVRRIAPDGTISTFAGSGGQGSSGDGGPATAAQLLTPRDVAVDAAGTVYISEFGSHRVRQVTPDGLIATAAGIGVAGFRGDGGPAADAQLDSPAGLAVDRSGALYIADSQNQRVRKILPGGLISTVLGGAPDTALQTPIAVTIDLNGNLYVADSSTVVRKYTAIGAWVNAAGTGDPGFYGDGGAATAAQLTEPLALAADLNGNLYIADGVRTRQVDTLGKIHTIAGDNYTQHIGDGAGAAAAELYQPWAVWLDGAGNLQIADTGTQRVRRVSAGTIATVAGTGVAAPGGEAVPAATSPLDYPMGVAVDAGGNVWIAETHAHRIRQVAAGGLIRTAMGTGAAGVGPEGMPPGQTQLRGPRGLCLDRAGTLYVADTANQRVLRWTPGGVVETAAGNGSPGAAGDGGSARLAQLSQPSACATDDFGNLFIADTYNHRIRKVDSRGNIATVAGTGVAGWSGDEGPATAAALNTPEGVAVDDNGNIYISDTGNHLIRQVTPDGVIHTIAGTGAAGFAGDAGPALSAQLNSPAGILLDGAGELYFADTGNNRVRRLVPAGAIDPPPVVIPPALSIQSAASMAAGPVAPGEIVTLLGAGLGPQAGAAGILDASGLMANQLAGAEVRFDGVPAPLLYAQASQINAQVPYTVSGQASTHVEVFYLGNSAGALDVPVVAVAPAVFPTVAQQDGTLNSQSHPAPHGTFLTLYATGDGLEYGPDLAGLPAAVPYPFPVLPATVTIGGMTAQIAYAGAAPRLVGILQVNVLVPGAFLPSGPAVLKLAVGAAAAPDVVVWIQ